MVSSPVDLVTRFLDLFNGWNENTMNQRSTIETLLSTQALLVRRTELFPDYLSKKIVFNLCL